MGGSRPNTGRHRKAAGDCGHGLRILVPGEVDRAAVHKIIYDELCLGIISERSRASYRAAINHLVEAGAEGIILGCTEIELLLADSESPVPLFPTTRLHVKAAVAVSLEGLEIAPTLAG